MNNNQEYINQLLVKLELLLKRQEDFSKEIYSLKEEIEKLKHETDLPVSDMHTTAVVPEVKQPAHLQLEEEHIPSYQAPPPINLSQTPKQSATPINKQPKPKSDIEKFIGENLINKIGIIITVIGVAIGAKYAIDHELISPLTRIILGYLAGIILLAFAFKLKRNYNNFSAVLLSGAMAIMYFITYIAYDFYALIPQLTAFVLMVVFTVFTVLAAINYNRQVIALFGLVGAYAVPFLLSDGSGNVVTLFTYMSIINTGILFIAFKKYWKTLFYGAFVFTWLIYFSWFVFEYRIDEQFGLALIFLCIFFITFYISFLAYKLIHKEKFDIGDSLLLIANSFIFYGFGYGLLSGHMAGRHMLGMFTLYNAFAHFIVTMLVYRQKVYDKNLFYLLVGLVLIFITIAIPVQLDGNWVTILWAGEAALLFYIGRNQSASLYEKFSYPVLAIAFFSLLQDWSDFYYNGISGLRSNHTPIFNIHFLTSLLFIAALSFINILSYKKKNTSAFASNKTITAILSFLLPGLLLFVIYNAFRVEIETYWQHQFQLSEKVSSKDGYPIYQQSNLDLLYFKDIWIINYSLLFASLLAAINLRYIKNRLLGLANIGLIVITIAAFLIQGLYVLSELRGSYLNQNNNADFSVSSFHIGVRYVSFCFVLAALYACYRYLKQPFLRFDFTIAFEFLLHTTILWVASSELIQWMDIAGSAHAYKLGLSILWGVYSLLLIVLGIWKKKKYLRVAAIALFGITLIKLFFYDISHLGTIAKTIVFVSLGVLLLIISFLYNKYKHIIFDETD